MQTSKEQSSSHETMYKIGQSLVAIGTGFLLGKISHEQNWFGNVVCRLYDAADYFYEKGPVERIREVVGNLGKDEVMEQWELSNDEIYGRSADPMVVKMTSNVHNQPVEYLDIS